MDQDDLSPEWHDVASRDQLDPDFPLGVEVNGQNVGLYLQDDEVRALEDICPHAYALLSQGFQENGQIECPLHGGAFEIRTGLPTSFPVVIKARTYEVRVEGDDILLSLAKR